MEGAENQQIKLLHIKAKSPPPPHHGLWFTVCLLCALSKWTGTWCCWDGAGREKRDQIFCPIPHTNQLRISLFDPANEGKTISAAQSVPHKIFTPHVLNHWTCMALPRSSGQPCPCQSWKPYTVYSHIIALLRPPACHRSRQTCSGVLWIWWEFLALQPLQLGTCRFTPTLKMKDLPTNHSNNNFVDFLFPTPLLRGNSSFHM